MVSVNLQPQLGFNIIGSKTWISGTDNALFGEFWQKCHREGVIERLQQYKVEATNSITHSAILGLSDTSQNPQVRSFYFFVAVETLETEDQGDFEVFHVAPQRWAIFSSPGSDINALMSCEMYAWTEWLPKNDRYVHANGPEMEVYFQEEKIEYWLPIREK